MVVLCSSWGLGLGSKLYGLALTTLRVVFSYQALVLQASFGSKNCNTQQRLLSISSRSSSRILCDEKSDSPFVMYDYLSLILFCCPVCCMLLLFMIIK